MIGEGRSTDTARQNPQHYPTQDALEEGIVMWNGTNRPIMICDNPSCCRIYESARYHRDKKCCSGCRRGWGHTPRCQSNHDNGVISSRTWYTWASQRRLNGASLLGDALRRLPIKDPGVEVG